MLNPRSPAQPAPPGAACPLRRDNLVPRFCEVIPSTLAALEAVQEQVLAVVKDLPCAPEELEAIELALREALANAILHGNRSDPAKKVVVLGFCECEAKGNLLLVVEDEGAGFDPTAVPDPTAAETLYSAHGRGIFLMRRLMDDVRYQKGGKEVELRKGRESGCSSRARTGPEQAGKDLRPRGNQWPAQW